MRVSIPNPFQILKGIFLNGYKILSIFDKKNVVIALDDNFLDSFDSYSLSRRLLLVLIQVTADFAVM